MIQLFMIDEDYYWIEDLKRMLMLEPAIRFLGNAASQSESLQKLQQVGVSPDVFLVHSVIQDGSAVDLIHQLKAKFPKAQFILQVAQPDATIYQIAQQLGVSQVIVKKSTPALEVLNMIKKAGGIQEQAQTIPPASTFPPPQGQPPMQPPVFPANQPAFPPQQPFQPHPQQPTQQPPGFPAHSPQVPFQQPPQVPFQQPPQVQPQNPTYPPYPANYPASPYPQQPIPQQPVAPYPGQHVYPFQQPPQPAPEPKPTGIAPRIKQAVIAIHSPKGGTGKSTVAKELAYAFCQVKIPNTRPGEDRLKVCLIDLNMEYGSIAGLMRISPVPNVSTWAEDMVLRQKNGKKMEYTSEAFLPFVVQHESGMHVIPAPPRPSQGNVLAENPNFVSIMIESLKNYYDVILIDTASNLSEYTLTAIEKAHKTLIVGTSTTSFVESMMSFLDAYKTVKLPLDKLGLVMNRMQKRSMITADQVENMIGISLFGSIVEDFGFEEANNNAVAYVLHKGTEASACIYRIAHQIMPAFSKQVQSASSGFLSIFKKDKK